VGNIAKANQSLSAPERFPPEPP